MKIWMMKWNHKMAPRWRHGWVIRLKRLLYPFFIRAKILWKFEDDCSFRFWDILNTKFMRFDLHLHSQDGLMSTCCYYIIWLVDHTAYACKIWARLDQWLLKYNTKRGLTFDLHLHSQDGLMSTWCYYVIDITRKYEKLCMVALIEHFTMITSSKSKNNSHFL